MDIREMWLWGNVIANVVMCVLGFVTFRQGVNVYRAGWRESCRKEVEREVLSRISTEQNNVVGQFKENYGSIELRDIAHGHEN